MLTAIIGVAVVALCLALVVAVAREPGPSPTEVALAYELAWDRLDFDTIWTLAGPELRDGRPRHEFVAGKRAAYDSKPGLHGLAKEVIVEDVLPIPMAAVIRTRITLRDGTIARNEVRLAQRDRRWQVVGYELRPDAHAEHDS